MANGKGSLDCLYCVHFDRLSELPADSSGGQFCHFHNVSIPRPRVEINNRICCSFEPNEAYNRDNVLPQFMPLARRFAWFGIDMKPGVLYEFPYSNPPAITESSVLRLPDYQKGTWEKADAHSRQEPPISSERE